MDTAYGEINTSFALKKLESKYFYWFLLAFIFVSGINMKTFAGLIAIAALKLLQWLFKDDYTSFFSTYLPYFEIGIIYLFISLLIPHFFWFSLLSLPLLLLRSKTYDVYDLLILHLYISIIAFFIQGLTSLLLYTFVIKIINVYPLSLVVLTFLSLIPAMFYYFATILKIKKQYFYEDYNLFIYVVSYVIIMTIVISLPLYF